MRRSSPHPALRVVTAEVFERISPLKIFFYFVLLLALLGAAAWNIWGPPPTFQLVRVQPSSPGVPVPANPPAAATPGASSVSAQPGAAAAGAPASRTLPQSGSLSAAELARSVTESQKQAVALYPALATPNSDFNARFVTRYQRLQAEHSPRLQEPDWPMQLAVECAAAGEVPMSPAAIIPAAPTQIALAARAPAAPAAAPAAAATVNTLARIPAAPPVASPTAPTDSGTAPLISLDVHSMNAGSTYNVRWLTYYYGYDVLGKTNKALDLDARNLSAHASTVVLQWIFTVHTDRRGGRAIFDMGSGNWDMQPNQSTHFGVRSADLNTHTTWYYNYGYGRYYGSEFDGWLVIAKYKDKVLKAVGSSGTLESLVGTPELATMVSAYQRVHPGGNTPPPDTVSAR